MNHTTDLIAPADLAGDLAAAIARNPLNVYGHLHPDRDKDATIGPLVASTGAAWRSVSDTFRGGPAYVNISMANGQIFHAVIDYKPAAPSTTPLVQLAAAVRSLHAAGWQTGPATAINNGAYEHTYTHGGRRLFIHIDPAGISLRLRERRPNVAGELPVIDLFLDWPAVSNGTVTALTALILASSRGSGCER
jgi:hypothetical protein